MGMDPSVTIWVGITDDCRITHEQHEQFMELDYAQVEGNRFSVVYCSEEPCGFGFEIVRHDWDFKVCKVDLLKWQAQVDTLWHAARAFFCDLHGIDEDYLGVWMHTDWS